MKKVKLYRIHQLRELYKHFDDELVLSLIIVVAQSRFFQIATVEVGGKIDPFGLRIQNDSCLPHLFTSFPPAIVYNVCIDHLTKPSYDRESLPFCLDTSDSVCGRVR